MKTFHGSALRLLYAAILAAMLVPAGLFAMISFERARAERAAAEERIARTLDVQTEHALKLFQTAELLIHDVGVLVAGHDDTAIRAEEPALHARLAEMAGELADVQSLWLIDADGHPLLSSLYSPPPPLSLNDRDFYIAHVQGGAPASFIGAPHLPRLAPREPFFSVSRRRNLADGSFGGVIEVSLKLASLQRFYGQLPLARQGVLALARGDGTVLVRAPDAGLDLPRFTALRDAVRDNPEQGLVMAPSAVDKAVRLIGYRRIAPYGVYATAAIDEAEITAAWHADMLGDLEFGLPATLLVLAALLLAASRTRRLYAEAARRVSAEQALARAQRMEALGQLTGGVAHDFNNLMMVLLGNLERLRRGERNDQDRRAIDLMEAALHRGTALTRQLLAFSRRKPLASEPVDLAQRIPELVDMLRRSLRGDISVDVHLPDTACPVCIDSAEFELALLNIGVNARDAMPRGGRLSVSVGTERLDAAGEAGTLSGRFAAICISDTGSGIAPEILPRVFDPFFTTKEFGRGTGLGLSQVYGFAHQSGGTVTIASTAGKGTQVKLFLPLIDAAPAAPPEPQWPMAPLGDGETVLLVEDNDEVAEIAAGYLDLLGFCSARCTSAQEALRTLRAGQAARLVLSDIVMPGGIDGLQLARALHAGFPQMPVLLMTGYSAQTEAARQEGFQVIAKPFNLAQLREAFTAVLNSERPAQDRLSA